MKIINSLFILLFIGQTVYANVIEDSIQVYFDQFKKSDIQDYINSINLIDKGHMQNESAPLFISFCLVRSLMQKSVSLIF